LYRINNKTFYWDANAVMDVLSIIGAAAMGVSKIAGARLVTAQKLFAVVPESEEYGAWVKRLSRFVKVADFTAEGVNHVTYMIGSMETVGNYLEIQRMELHGDLSKSEARKKRIELAKSAMIDQIMQHMPGMVEQYSTKGKVVGRKEQAGVEPVLEPPHELVPPSEPKAPAEEKKSVTPEMPKTPTGTEPKQHVAGAPVAEPKTVGEFLGEGPGIHGVKEVPVRRGERLTGDETRVKFEDGKVVLELGPKANSDNVRQHLDTIKMMQRYEGALGFVIQLLSKFGQMIGLGPAFGTKGFEAKLELEKLGKIKTELEGIKASIEKEMAIANGTKEISELESKFGELLQKISAIEKQAKGHEAELNSTEAGRGYVAMADTTVPKKGVMLDVAQKTALLKEKTRLKTVRENAIKRRDAASEKISKLQKLEQQRAASTGDIEKLRAIKQEINKVLDGEFTYEKVGDLKDPLERYRDVQQANNLLIDQIEPRLKAIDVQMNPETFRAPFECFSGDTLVQTSSGPKRIDQVNVGDTVYTFDEKEKTIVQDKVIDTHANLTKHFYHVTAKGELIKSTGGHPFYDAEHQSWLPVKNFSRGMKFLTMNEGAWPVDEIRFEAYETELTYNLSIEKNHNYFVGPGILVHNTKPTITSGGAIDTGLGGDQMVYRGTNPDFPGEVYIGRTVRGEGTRQGEHRNSATNFLFYYAQLETLIKSEGSAPTPAKQKVYDALNNAINRKESTYTSNTFTELTHEKHFFEFMSKVELTPIVVGMKTEEQAKFVEQKNMQIEREQLGQKLVNRREETVSSSEELNNTVKAQLKNTSYCP
jgi:hypothetical protein